MKKLIIPLAILLALISIISGCSTTSTTTPSISTTPTVTNPGTGAIQPSASVVSPVAQSTPNNTTPASSTTPEYGGTLIDIESQTPGSPFGWPPDVAGGAGVTAQIGLDQLLHEDYNGNILPNLATSYDIVTDPANASITFHLRQGVKFQDGTDFNAQAVKWNLDMLKNGLNPSVTNSWKSWEVLDDYTIKVDLKTWQNIVVRNFTGMGTLMASPTAYQQNGVDWMRWNMVGTGAFQQVSYNDDVSMTAIRFANYWEKGKPYLDGIQLLYVTDPVTRLALFKSGGGDLMGVTPKDAFDLQNEGYNIIDYPAAANVLIPDSMNADSPWANVEVREAASYAIDREAMSKALGFGFNPPAYQLPPPNSPAIVPSITGRKYDPAKAKQLLAEAGYPNGFKTTIITSSTLDPNGAAAIQGYFAAVGIKADIQFVEAARLASVLTGTWHGILYHQLRPFPNFNADLSLEFGSPYTTFYKSLKKPDGWQQILDATLNSPQPDPKLMQAATQALYDDCTAIPVTYYAGLYATQPYVNNTGRGEMGSQTQFTPQNAWLSK